MILEKENTELAQFTDKKAATKDGFEITLNANIGNVEESYVAFEKGADIGVLSIYIII